MITDIVDSANKKLKYKQALKNPVTIEPLLDRVLLLPIELEEEKVSGLIIDEQIKKNMQAGELKKALVKAVGPGKPEMGTGSMNLEVGDIVYVDSDKYMCIMIIDEVLFYVFGQHNIIAKEAKTV